MFIWTVTEPERLSPLVREALASPANDRFLSLASVWEMAIKEGSGRLRILDRLDEGLATARISLLPIAVRHALAAGALPPHHRDPFDRMLVAQAVTEGMTLVSDDRAVAAYDVPLLGRAIA